MITQRKAPPSENKWGRQVLKSHCKRKTPPFARRLKERLEQGIPVTNDIFIVVGGAHAYSKAKNMWYSGNVALTYHPADKVADYDWPVQEQSVLIFDLTTRGITAQHYKSFALELLNSGALVVRYVTPEHSLIVFQGVSYERTTTH
jgi:hypothetical protein